MAAFDREPEPEETSGAILLEMHLAPLGKCF